MGAPTQPECIACLTSTAPASQRIMLEVRRAPGTGVLEVMVDGEPRGLLGVGRSRACEASIDGDVRISARHCYVACGPAAAAAAQQPQTGGGGAPAAGGGDAAEAAAPLRFWLVDTSKHGTWLARAGGAARGEPPLALRGQPRELRSGDTVSLLPFGCRSAPPDVKRRARFVFTVLRGPGADDGKGAPPPPAEEGLLPALLPPPPTSAAAASASTAAARRWGKIAGIRKGVKAAQTLFETVDGTLLPRLPPIRGGFGGSLPKQIRRQINDDDANTRVRGIRALGALRSRAVAPQVAELAARHLRDPDARVREAAVDTLECVGSGGDTAPCIEPYVDDIVARVADAREDSFVREAAARALGRLGENGLEGVIQLQADALADSMGGSEGGGVADGAGGRGAKGAAAPGAWAVREAAGRTLIRIHAGEAIRAPDPPWRRELYGFEWDGKPC